MGNMRPEKFPDRLLLSGGLGDHKAMSMSMLNRALQGRVIAAMPATAASLKCMVYQYSIKKSKTQVCAPQVHSASVLLLYCF
jgi:hypothetical protein